MDNEIITVRTYYYMPYRIVMFLFLLAGTAGLLNAGRYVLGFVVLTLAAMVLTSHYGIRINKKTKTYNDFFSVLGILSGEEVSYEVIEYVFIVSNNKNQTTNSLITSQSFTDDYFDGYIKFDHDEKVFLLSHKNKNTVMKTVAEISSRLGVKIVDHTDRD